MSAAELLRLYHPIHKQLDAVKNCMASELSATDSELIQEIMTHVLSSSGKLVRSACVLFSFKTGKAVKDDEKAIQFAAVIETIHLASLIHDDVIDESDTRRNIPSIYSKFGSGNAIVSGTYAYAIAVKLLSKIGDLDILNSVSHVVKTLCEGELAQARSYEDTTLDTYLNAIYGKTAVLFEAACENSARLSGGNIEALKTYGRSLGYIFQLTDDYLDVFGEAKDLSKAVGQDFEVGVITLPYLFLYQKLTADQQQVLLNLDSFSDLKTKFSIELQEVRIQVKDVILGYVEDAIEALKPLESVSKKPLLILLDLVEKRIKK